MTGVVTLSCEVCGRRDYSPDWLRVTELAESLVFSPATEGKRSFFDGLLAHEVCGADCAQKSLSRWLKNRETEKEHHDRKQSPAVA